MDGREKGSSGEGDGVSRAPEPSDAVMQAGSGSRFQSERKIRGEAERLMIRRKSLSALSLAGKKGKKGVREGIFLLPDVGP